MWIRPGWRPPAADADWPPDWTTADADGRLATIERWGGMRGGGGDRRATAGATAGAAAGTNPDWPPRLATPTSHPTGHTGTRICTRGRTAGWNGEAGCSGAGGIFTMGRLQGGEFAWGSGMSPGVACPAHVGGECWHRRTHTHTRVCCGRTLAIHMEASLSSLPWVLRSVKCCYLVIVCNVSKLRTNDLLRVACFL